jgi:hypothetical protein
LIIADECAEKWSRLRDPRWRIGKPCKGRAAWLPK